MTTTAPARTRIEGTVAPGWEPVRDAFEENFRSRGEVGADRRAAHPGNDHALEFLKIRKRLTLPQFPCHL